MTTATATPNKSHSTPLPPVALHESFSWANDKHGKTAEFVGMTLDVCNGFSTCLELIRSSDLQRVEGQTPLLDQFDTGNLFRLLVTTSKLLSHDAEKYMDLLNTPRSGREIP